MNVDLDIERHLFSRLRFVEVRKFGDGTLRPLWKKTEVSTVPERPKNFIDDDDEARLAQLNCTLTCF